MKKYFDPGIIQRMGAKSGALWESYLWVKPDPEFESEFMGPGQPPLKTIADIDPRIFDYEVGENLKTDITPGRDGITHAHLRAFAEACEPVRLIIENKKNQVETHNFDFQLRYVIGKSPQQVKEETENNPQIKKARELFNKPDGQRKLKRWLRIVLEEVLVLDHLCIYPVRNVNGEFFRFKVLDGANILKRIDKNGDTPEPPSIAYQQKIKGVVVNDFISAPIADKSKLPLFVFHRNPRVSKTYGFSPVEQIITYINIILRRLNFQLNYYTEGNIPDMLLRVTADWDDQKIAKFQRYFDLMLRGDLKQRRRVRFIPESADPIYPQEGVLAEDQEFQEFLLRIVTYAFGSTPNHFIRNLNRSVSEQQREQSDEEGLFAVMEVVKEIMDTLLHDYLGLTDVEFFWVPNRSQDSLKQAQIDKLDVESGIRSIDEVRDARGLPPIGFGNAVKTAHGYVSITTDGENKLETIYTDIDKTGDSDPEADNAAQSKGE